MPAFHCDYAHGALPEILNRLQETNRNPSPGYGNDKYCESAAAKIRTACNTPDAEIHFLSGGTSANMIVIASLLKPFEGVFSAETGHINVHEAGAIEYTGHKVLTLPSHTGKIHAEDIRCYMTKFYGDDSHDHMVFPGMVYISHPTELGTLYSKAELTELSEVCRQYDLPLFLDGARLGYALGCPENDVSLEEIARLCDVFYIGGTKVGTLYGEAVVFPRDNAPKHFHTVIKQMGGMAAKGFLTGIQFDTMFTDDLYRKAGAHGIRMAQRLRAVFEEKGIPFAIENPTNQIFVTLDNETMERLKQDVTFGFWEVEDDSHTVVRFVTSWATTEEDIETLRNLL